MQENILTRKKREIERVGAIVNAPDRLIERFFRNDEVVNFEFDARVGDRYERFEFTRIQHLNPYQPGARPYKGGIRLYRKTTPELLTVLAMDMTEKCLLAGLPFGGAKGGIALDPAAYSEIDLRGIIEKMVFESIMRSGIPDSDIDSFGPDIGVSERAMLWMYRTVGSLNRKVKTPNVAAAVTGKPLEHEGLPGREDATSHGLLIQLEHYLAIARPPFANKDKVTVAVQGFGNVGSNVACLIENDKRFRQFMIVAVSDRSIGIYNPKGLPFDELKRWRAEQKTFKDFPHGGNVSVEELLELPVDILIPASVEDQITAENAPRIKAKLIFEGANEPTTPEALEILHEAGVDVVPGIAANVGGVIGSSFEWRMNRGDRKHHLDFDEEKRRVTKNLTKNMHDIIETVYAKSNELRCSMPDAAHIITLERLEQKLKEQ